MENINDVVAKNILEFMKKRNISMNELCKNISYAQGNMSRFLSREIQDIRLQILNELAEKYNVPVEYFIKGYTSKKTREVLFFDIEPAAGSQSFFEENHQSKIKLSDELLESIGYSADKLIMLQIRGDSMQPTFNNNDYIFELKEFNNSDLRSRCYVICDKYHGYRVKRINLGKTGEIIVISDNPIYEKEIYTKEELTNSELRIISPVVAKLSLQKI